MNGLLRRFRRGRAAGDGEAPQPEPGAAPTTGRTSASTLFTDPARGSEEPDRGGAAPARPESPTGDGPRHDQAPSGGADRSERAAAAAGEPGGGAMAAEPAGGGPAAASATAATRAADASASEPALGEPAGAARTPARDPSVPAGLDAAEAAARPPAGRRGRLRRRLRYLRRARELMLRDLGGLVYEVHRTGGGDLPAHMGLVGAKVQRLMALDAEAHGLESALSAPREQVVLFEPGVGGSCSVCGELYGSDARFCSNCGTPTGGEAEPAAAGADPAPPTATASERAPTLAGPVVEPVVPIPEPPPAAAAPGAEAATSVLATGGQATQSFAGPGTDEERDAREEAAARGEARAGEDAAASHDDTRVDEGAPASVHGEQRTAGPDDPVDGETSPTERLAARERRP